MIILNKRILIQPIQAEKSAGGIFLPDAANPDRQDQEGIVVAIGSGIKEDLPFRKGSHVFIEMYKAGETTAIEYLGIKYRLVDIAAIVGVATPNCAFRPVGNKILLKPIVTINPDSKIVRPSAYESDEGALVTCTVYLLGNGVRNKKGEYRPFEVKVGDTVIVKAFAGREVDLSDATYMLVKQSDIEATI